ncbi:MAG: cell division protein FtsZ [Deltaproteobacteria bacterium]|nr:cell division protein FtsZ [Deltaproteobacteria bacterium]MBW2069300.1 cell division protein FtsZ [Deltaproteobacteria bacterium]
MEEKRGSKKKYFDISEEELEERQARIKVVGIGGAGNNAINNMIAAGLDGVEFIAANTDYQVLKKCSAPVKILLGTNTTRGLGAGGNPELGAKATEEDIDKIREEVEDSDMVFITAGMGGGTGTGGAPIVARVCKELGALTVAVVTKPFSFEGRPRMRNAMEGLAKLEEVVDTIITIPNDRLTTLSDKRATFLEMFKKADDVLLYAVKGISDLIVNPGYINVDFADVKAVMSDMGGMALMGTGIGRGENRASEAATQAISSPLLEDVSIQGAKAILVNITAGPDLTMHEFEEISSIINSEVDEEADIYLGTAIDQNIGEELRVTVIATGIGAAVKKKQETRGESGRVIRVRPRQSEAATSSMIPDPDYEYLEIPTIERQGGLRQREEENETEENWARRNNKRRSIFRRFRKAIADEEDLNIPTFIRRQVD